MKRGVLIIKILDLSRPERVPMYFIEEEVCSPAFDEVVHHIDETVVGKPNIVQTEIQGTMQLIAKRFLHVLQHQGRLACPTAAHDSDKAGIP